jgi:hypothetical protein
MSAKLGWESFGGVRGLGWRWVCGSLNYLVETCRPKCSVLTMLSSDALGEFDWRIVRASTIDPRTYPHFSLWPPKSIRAGPRRFFMRSPPGSG